MRVRDIIIGVLVIGAWVVIVAWVAVSVYHHEYVGSASQLLTHLPT